MSSVDLTEIGLSGSGRVANGGAQLSFASILDAQELLGQGNLLPSTKSDSVAFDAGLFCQHAVGRSASPTPAAVSPSPSPAASGPAPDQVKAGVNGFATALEMTPSSPQAAAPSQAMPIAMGAKTIDLPGFAPGSSDNSMARVGNLQLPTVAVSVSSPFATPSLAPKSIGPGVEAVVRDGSTRSASTFSQMPEPEEMIPPQALTVIESEAGPVIAYSLSNDLASLSQIKAIAESLMLEYSIPIARLFYKNTQVLLGSALAKGVE